MNNTLYIYQFIGWLAAIAFFVPLSIALYRKQIRNTFFTSFIIYWTWAGLVNIIFISGIVTNRQILFVVERTYNLIDAPVLLCLLFFALPLPVVKQKLRWFIPAYLVAEVIFIFITGLSGTAEIILVGAGIFAVLSCIIAIISFNLWGTKKIQSPGSPQMFIYYALLFEYGVSVITFLFNYIFPERNNTGDSFFIFHIATIITISIASYGFITYSPKGKTPQRQKLSKPKEREVEIRYL
ncbi:MAG: hypothetical protein KF746_27555 [Chitinophagaceae bacterium]|nr:hypothetical protein [Chitinophagaceae bacterium]